MSEPIRGGGCVSVSTYASEAVCLLLIVPFMKKMSVSQRHIVLCGSLSLEHGLEILSSDVRNLHGCVISNAPSSIRWWRYIV